jgi:hypothetical protein
VTIFSFGQDYGDKVVSTIVAVITHVLKLKHFSLLLHLGGDKSPIVGHLYTSTDFFCMVGFEGFIDLNVVDFLDLVPGVLVPINECWIIGEE